MELSIGVADSVGTIHVSGEVDITNVAPLDKAVNQLLADGATTLVFDCAELTFIDSTGLAVLLRAYKAARARNGSVTVRHPSRFVRRLLDVTGLGAELRVDSVGV